MAATLTRYSTAEDVLNEIRDNASFLENGSVAEAKAFVTAYIHWLTHHAKMANVGGKIGELFELQVEQWAAVYESAKQYVVASDTQANGGAGVTHVDFRDFRS